MYQPGVPASLHNRYIRGLEEPGDTSLPVPHRYHALPVNNPPIEKASRNKYRLLTSENWESYLKERESRVVIPITLAGIHWSVVEEHGNDRFVELLYIGSRPMGENDTQLNFHPVRPDGNGLGCLDVAHPCYRVACRVSGLSTYRHKMYYRMTDEESARDRLRYDITGWRSAVNRDD